jgi:hypothetical protein
MSKEGAELMWRLRQGGITSPEAVSAELFCLLKRGEIDDDDLLDLARHKGLISWLKMWLLLRLIGFSRKKAKA